MEMPTAEKKVNGTTIYRKQIWDVFLAKSYNI